MDETTAQAYLERIGTSRPTAPTLEALATLMQAHLATVPFENLSIHLGEPIDLSEHTLIDKLVYRRRGGFCYELNGGFAALLRHLGFEVTLHAARVHTPVGLGPPYDHLTLRVDLDEPWLVDVGFGKFVASPVPLTVGETHQDPSGTVQFVPAPYNDLDVLLDGEAQFRMDTRPRELSEFITTCWWHQTSPESHFTRSFTCSLPTANGRVTLSDRLLITTTDGVRKETRLGSDDDVLTAYRTHFGIELSRLPASTEVSSLGQN
jgi:N-hydroxyarylamine O-acetyltransferase